MTLKELTKNYKKLGHKGFMQKWKEGILKITPLQQLKGEISGYIGSIIGMLLAGTMFVIRGMWYVAPILFFGLIIQVFQLIGKYQQYQTFKTLESGQINNIQDLIMEEEDGRSS